MGVDLDDFPSLRQELDRKALEAVEFLTQSLKLGKITQHQYSTGLDVLSMNLNGLVDSGFVELLTEAGNLCPKEPQIISEVFFIRGNWMKVSWTVGSSSVSVKVGASVTSKDYGTPEIARKRFKDIGDRIEARGFSRL
jgi:hypothetical protein